MIYLKTVLLLLTIYAANVYSAITNSVVGTPTIECQANNMQVALRTKESFAGRIFMKGNSHKKECVMDYSAFSPGSLTLAEATQMVVAVNFDRCNTERLRTLTPNGVTYENTIVIQFHKTFITNSDKVYHLKCFYAEQEKTVGYDFDVSMITTRSVMFDMELPACSYTVRRGRPNGAIVRSARVGDTVYHRWECQGNSEVYGMLVHSCYVEDTQGEMNQIIDEDGCALDQILLPDLSYNDELSLAYRETQVFKYPDHSFVHFKCQIKICTKMDSGCAGISPPECNLVPSRSRTKRMVHFANEVNETEGYGTFDGAHLRTHGLDVASKKILVLDESEDSTDDVIDNFSNSVADVSSASHLNRPLVISPQLSPAIVVDSTSVFPKDENCYNKSTFIGLFVGFFGLFVCAFIFIVYFLYKHPPTRAQLEKITFQNA